MAKDIKTTPTYDQGFAAVAAGLSEADCPYAEGDNRDQWLAGFAAGEPAKEA